jgi:hypothetical protein
MYSSVQAALDSRLSTMVSDIPIAWENTKFNPTVGTAYLRPTLLSSPSDNINLSGLQQNPGIYQIDLFFPVDVGWADMLEKLDQIYNHFKNSILTHGGVNVVIQQISRTPTRRDGVWFSTSVNINFICYFTL